MAYIYIWILRSFAGDAIWEEDIYLERQTGALHYVLIYICTPRMSLVKTRFMRGNMKDIIKKRYMYIIAVLLIVVDQISKVLVLKYLYLESRNIIGNWLKFSYCENRGVAFSLGEGNVPLFIIVNLILIVGLVVFYEKQKNKINKLGTVCISLTIAGGISNLIDRLFRGFVVDFIDVNGIVNFAIFNIADIFITCGVIGLCIAYIFKDKNWKVDINDKTNSGWSKRR